MTHRSKLPIDNIIEQLGYRESDNLIFKPYFNNTSLTTYTKKILKEISPYAAYIINKKLFALFFDSSADNFSISIISKLVWNAQIPLVFIAYSNTVIIYNGLSIDTSSNNILMVIEEQELSKCNFQNNFAYWKISNNDSWSCFFKEKSMGRLNESLLENIRCITERLKITYKIPFATKLILRLIFIRFLIDRGVDINFNQLSNNLVDSQKKFIEIVNKKTELYNLFKHLQGKFEGSLFELTDELENALLTPEVFLDLACFVSGELNLRTRQFSLFPLYDFNIIPIELISNIYEILLGEEKQQKENAFYTPHYLSEYILDKTLTPFIKSNQAYKPFKVLDPSCGSGVFLVDSYRRLIDEAIAEEQFCNDDKRLHDLLLQNIYGIDINDEAIDITIFSLYLTMLDYKDPKTLSGFKFPSLKGSNLFVSDFFDDDKLDSLKRINFNFIIGNPPWSEDKSELHLKFIEKNGYANRQRKNEICRSFVLRTKDFCSKNTKCCFILHSKILYNTGTGAVHFRETFLEEAKILYILELSSVREEIFKNAQAPAAILAFQYNQCDNLDNQFEYTSLKPNIFFSFFNIIAIEKSDVKYVTQNLLYKNDWAWKTIVYGLSQDIDNIFRLKKQYSTLIQNISGDAGFVCGAGAQMLTGDANDSTHLIGLPIVNHNKDILNFNIQPQSGKIFEKEKIHRPRQKELMEPPCCAIAKGIDCKNFKMRSGYTTEKFLFTDAIHIIKSDLNKQDELLNICGLLNSSMYAYMNLMLGSSVGVEREQRLWEEIKKFPYVLHKDIVNQVKIIRDMAKDTHIHQISIEKQINKLDEIVLKAFQLYNNNSVDYALRIQIPELTKQAPSQEIVKIDDLKSYGKVFSDRFTQVYKQVNKYIAIEIYPNLLNKYSIFQLNIKGEKSKDIINIHEENIQPDKEFISKFCIAQYNDNFYRVQNVIHFTPDSFFILKPNFYKYWHPAIAEQDLSEVIHQIMTAAEELENV